MISVTIRLGKVEHDWQWKSDFAPKSFLVLPENACYKKVISHHELSYGLNESTGVCSNNPEKSN